MKKFYKKHREKINYLLVGAWNTVFGYFTFVILYFLLSARIHYMFILGFSNVLSITNAYVGYKTFVFRTRGNYIREYLRFYVVYGAAIGLNFILLPIVVEVLSVNPVIAQGIIIWLTIIFSYFGHKRFSFRKEM